MSEEKGKPYTGSGCLLAFVTGLAVHPEFRDEFQAQLVSCSGGGRDAEISAELGRHAVSAWGADIVASDTPKDIGMQAALAVNRAPLTPELVKDVRDLLARLRG